ncbi:MAG: hypothetical protein ABIP97_06485 [Chthoniobacterales bacterium]
MPSRYRFIYLTILTALLCLTASASEDAATTISFASGKWNASQWTPVRLPNQEKAVPLIQKPTSIGTTEASFSETDYGKERDNALSLYDTGILEGQVEVTLGLGKGFGNFSSPGVCISPTVKDGNFVSGIAVFVGTYAVAVWYEYAEGDVMKYKHLAQITRWSDPTKQHVLRCRFSKKKQCISINIDNSDILTFEFVGNLRLSNIPQEINSTIALWGCHGVSDFYTMTILDAYKMQGEEGLLPFFMRTDPKAGTSVQKKAPGN